MPRDTKHLQHTLSTPKRWTLTASLLLVGIILAGLRLPGTENPSLAQPQNQTTTATSTDSKSKDNVEEAGEMAVESDHIQSIAYSPKQKILAGASWDKTVKIWNAESGKLLRSIKGHNGYVRTVAFSPDGQLLASASDDGTVKIWNPHTTALQANLKGHGNTITDMEFTPDEKTLIVMDRNYQDDDSEKERVLNRVRLWNVQSAELKGTLTLNRFAVSLAVSPDSQWLAVSLGKLKENGPGGIDLWNLETQEVQRSLVAKDTSVYSVAFSPDGEILAGSLPDKSIILWDSHHTWTGSLGNQTRPVFALAFSPDGTKLATGSAGPVRHYNRGRGQVVLSEVRLWDIQTGNLLHTIHHGVGRVTSLAFTADGQNIAYCDSSGVKTINSETGKIEWERQYGFQNPLVSQNR